MIAFGTGWSSPASCKGGFPPVLYALASKFGLSGSVGNDSTRVVDMPLGEQLPRIC